MSQHDTLTQATCPDPAQAEQVAGEVVAYRIDYPRNVDPIGLRRFIGKDEFSASRGTLEYLGGIFVPLYTHPTPSPAQPAPVVPDGWKLVPVEPTEEMSLAGRAAWQGHHMAVYRAMLAATPTPPAQAAQQREKA